MNTAASIETVKACKQLRETIEEATAEERELVAEHLRALLALAEGRPTRRREPRAIASTGPNGRTGFSATEVEDVARQLKAGGHEYGLGDVLICDVYDAIQNGKDRPPLALDINGFKKRLVEMCLAGSIDLACVRSGAVPLQSKVEASEVMLGGYPHHFVRV